MSIFLRSGRAILGSGIFSRASRLALIQALASGAPAGPVLSGPTSLTISEGVTALGTYTANEPVTLSLEGPDAGLVSISSEGVATLNDPSNYEDRASLVFTVRGVSIATGLASTRTVLVTVTDLDEIAPGVTGPASVTLAEGGTALASYTFNEPVTVTYTGTDAALLAAPPGGLVTSLNVATSAPTNYTTKAAYSFNVRAVDAAGNVTVFPVAITITDVADPPTLVALSLSVSTVPEGTAPGVLVGFVQDTVAGSTVELTDDAGGRFALAANPWRIVTGLTATNYADATSHTIVLRETAAGAEPRSTILVVSVSDVAVGDPSAVKAAVMALEGATQTGRQSSAPLKVPGVTALPTGVSASNFTAFATITVSGNDVTLEDWDFTGYELAVNGQRCTIRNCVLGEQTAPIPDASGYYYIIVGASAHDLLVEWCDLWGFDGVGGSGTFINFTKSGLNALATAALRPVIRRNHFRHNNGDYIKCESDGALIAENFFDEPSCYPPGTPTYDAGATYSAGQPVLRDDGALFVSLVNGNTGNPLPSTKNGSTAFWDGPDPHADPITIRGALGPVTIRNNLFRCRPGDRSPGMTQYIRVIRDTGTGIPTGLVRISGNVFEPYGGLYPLADGGIREYNPTATTPTEYDVGEYALGSSGTVYANYAYRSIVENTKGLAPEDNPSNWVLVGDIDFEGPIAWENNWVGAGRNGSYYQGDGLQSNVVWRNMRDYTTDALITPKDRFTVVTDGAPAFGALASLSVPAQVGPAASYTIAPTGYGTIRDGGADVSACVLVVGWRPVGYIRSNGSTTVFPNRGATLTPLGNGRYHLALVGPDGVTPLPAPLTLGVGSAASVSVGLVVDTPLSVLIDGQSENAVGLFLNSATYTSQTYPALDQNVDFQFILRSTNDKLAGGPRVRTLDTTVIGNKDCGPGLVALANTLHRGSGGRAWRIGDNNMPGTGMADKLDDDGPSRSFTDDKDVSDLMISAWSKIDHYLYNWWNSEATVAKTFVASRFPYFYGLNSDGSDYGFPSGTQADSTGVGNNEWSIFDKRATKTGGYKGQIPEVHAGSVKVNINPPGLRIADYPGLGSGAEVLFPTPLRGYTRTMDGQDVGGMVWQNAIDAVAKRKAFLAASPAENRGVLGVTPAICRFGDYEGGAKKPAPSQTAIHPAYERDGQLLYAQHVAYSMLMAAGYKRGAWVDRVETTADGMKTTFVFDIPPNFDMRTIRKNRIGKGLEALPGSLRPHQQLDGIGFSLTRTADLTSDAQTQNMNLRMSRPIYRADAPTGGDNDLWYPQSHRGTVTIANPGAHVGGGKWEARVEIAWVQPVANGERVYWLPDGGIGGFIIHGHPDYDARLYKDALIVHDPQLDDGTIWGYDGFSPEPQYMAIISGVGAVADTTPPTLSGSTPADNATAVAVGNNVVLTFSEAVQLGTSGTITLRVNNSGTWSDAEVFDVSSEVGTGNGQVSASGSSVTINPTSALQNSREYAVRVSSGAIRDAAGNPFAGIANDTTLSFTTEAASAPAAQTFTINGTSGPYFTAQENLPANTTGWTMAFKGNIPASARGFTTGTRFFLNCPSTSFLVGVTFDGTLQITVEDDAGIAIWSPGNAVGLSLPMNGTNFDLIVSVDQPARELRVALNNTVTTLTLAVPTTGRAFFQAIRRPTLFAPAAGTNPLPATVERLRMWYASAPAGQVPAATPYIDMQGPASAVNGLTFPFLKAGTDAT